MPRLPYCDKSFSGPLSEVLTRFIRFKRAAGNKYEAEERHHRVLDKFASSFGCPQNTLTKELVLSWIEKRPHEKALTQIKRTNAVNRLARFMSEHGYDSYVYPYSQTKDTPAYMPHIFSEDEIGRILSLADSYRSTRASPNLNIAVPLVFRILYGCGLRTSEIINLRICDIDIDKGVISVIDSKFEKSRLIPMAPSLKVRCAEYVEAMGFDCIGYDRNKYFFPNPRGNRYGDQAIYLWFRNLLAQAGIPHGGKGSGPRVHDMRHTFAVHCLKRWVTEDKNIHALLPILSTYMGHCDLRGTQAYLRLTPDLFPVISDTMCEFFADRAAGG